MKSVIKRKLGWFGVYYYELQPFTTDQCSGGMSWIWRKLTGKEVPWTGCCIKHDEAYWKGGSVKQRKKADKRLKKCVKKNGYPVWAWLMYYGVRIGGVSWLPTPWRWGYGYKRIKG